MDIYLIATDGQEINLTQAGLTSARFVTDYLGGALNFPEIEHQVDRDVDKRYRLMDTFQRPIVVDLTLHVVGSTVQNLLSELSTIFSMASFSKTPLKIKVVEGSKTVYLDVHPQSSAVIPNYLSSEVKIRLVSYGKWYYGTETTMSLLSNQIMAGDYSRIFRIAEPAPGAAIFEAIATPSSKSTNFVALGSGLSSDLYFGINGSDTINGVTINRIGAMNSSHTVRAVSGIVNGEVTSIVLGRNNDGYVAGTFTRAGGSVGDYIGRLSFNNVAKLDVDGLNGVPKGFCFYKQDVLAFGSFTQTSGGQNARRLVVLNGSSLAEFEGAGANGDVNCVINYKDGIIIGGNYTSVGGVSATKLCYLSDTQIFSFPLPQINGYPSLVYKYKDNLYLVWFNSGILSYYMWNGSGWTLMFTTTSDILRPETIDPVKLWNREVIFGYKGIYEIRGKSFYKVFGDIDPILATRAFGRIYVVKEKLPTGNFLEVPRFIQVSSPAKIAPRIQGFSSVYGVPIRFDISNVTNGGRAKLDPAYLVNETLYADCNTGEIYTERGLDLKSLDSIYDPCQNFRLEKGLNYIFKYPPSGTDYYLKIPLQFDTLEEALAWS